jgi:tRNA (guanine37-N1)-methyltransferase
VRVSCEDGRDFIRAAIGLALDNPFPPYSGPRPSRIQERKIRKLKQAADALESSGVDTLDPSKTPRSRISHFVMNLPDTAIHFLDAFRGILSAVNNNKRDLRDVYDVMPMIHCHCFSRELETEKAEKDIKTVCLSRQLFTEVQLNRSVESRGETWP